MDRGLTDALQRCLEDLDQDRTPQDCAEPAPEHTAALSPLIEAAQAARSARMQQVPEDIVRRSQAKLLAEAARLRSAQRGSKPRRLSIPRFAFALGAFLIVIITSGYAITTASAEALPGDVLYPVKRWTEQVRLDLVTETGKTSLRETYRERRTDETMQVMAQGRTANVSFYGVLEAKNPDNWILDSVPVYFDEETEIDELAQIGDLLSVEGMTSGEGRLIASLIMRQRFVLSGNIEAQEGSTWRISGLEVHTAAAQAYIDLSEYGPGSFVTVLVDRDEHGRLQLVSIDERLFQEPEDDDDDAEVEVEEEDEDRDDDRENREGEEREPSEITFSGTLEAYTNFYLRVSGVYLRITGETRIDDDLEVGDPVEVEALRSSSGILVALKIEEASGADEGEDTDEQEDEGEEDEEGQEEEDGRLEDDVDEDEPDDEDPLETPEPEDDDPPDDDT